MSMSYGDCFDSGESECCGASIYIDGRCAECKDHCEAREEDEEEEEQFVSRPVQLKIVVSGPVILCIRVQNSV